MLQVQCFGKHTDIIQSTKKRGVQSPRVPRSNTSIENIKKKHLARFLNHISNLICYVLLWRTLCLTKGWTIGRSRFDPRQWQKIFLLAPASRTALGPTQPPIQWVPGVLSPGVKRGRGVTLTTHPHLLPRLSMSRSYTYSPPKRLHGV
jgi:hypothetical protein